MVYDAVRLLHGSGLAALVQRAQQADGVADQPQTTRAASGAELWAVWQRLFPHFLGYVPYITVWGVLFHSFFFNIAGAERGPPAFVSSSSWASWSCSPASASPNSSTKSRQTAPSGTTGVRTRHHLLLTCVTILYMPSLTPFLLLAGEFSYLVLSLFSKGLLGMTLVANVLLYDSFDDAVSAA